MITKQMRKKMIRAVQISAATAAIMTTGFTFTEDMPIDINKFNLDR